MSDIVISGISGRWPKSDNLDQLWDNLKQAIPLYEKDDCPYAKIFPFVTKSRGAINNPKLFDSQFFGYSEPDAADLDAQFRILHEIVYESIWDAGIVPEDWRSTRTGFFVGSFTDDTNSVINPDKRVDFLQLSASRIPYVFNFTGPTVRVDTACASSLTALHEAVLAMRRGQCDQAIVAGLSIHQRLGIVVEGSELELFSKSGKSRSLDIDADGYIRSEAIIALVLQRSTQAKRKYLTVLGSAANSDGYTVAGITSPSAEAQTKVMIDALNSASVSPLDVDYIEAHVTSTQAGDVAECSSILAAYRAQSDKPITLGCIKANLGHSEAASGLTAIAKAIKIFQTKMIPPNIGLVTPNPKIEGLKNGRLVPVSKTLFFNGKYIGVNGFGFGGSNAHTIVSCDAPDYQPPSSGKSSTINYRLICLCNRTIKGINKMVKWIQCEPKVTREDCLSLLDDISLTQISSGMVARGFVLINNQGNIIKQSKTIVTPNCGKINLTVELDSSLTNYMKILSTLKPFSDSIASCYQHGNQTTHLGADVTLIVTYIGIIDLLTSLGLEFNLITTDPVYLSTLNDYKAGKMSRREVINFTRRSKETGKLKANGPKDLPLISRKLTTINSSSQCTMHLSSNLMLTLAEGNKLLQSPDNLSFDDWIENFYSIIGILYLHGFTIKLSSLYPAYNYPVARDCPSLSGLISWSHKTEYPVLERYSQYFDLPKQTTHRVDLLDPEYFSVADHVIDDRVIFPATGYIYLFRKHLALIYYGPYTDIFAFSFKVWKVDILRAAFITEPIEFTVNYDSDLKYFEILSSGVIYATGFGSVIQPTPTLTTTNSSQQTDERFDYSYIKTIESEELDLNREEFYQEMAISGYRYQPAYQNIVSVKITRSSAVLNYTKDWMAFADNFLQLEAFWLPERKLLVPTKIDEMRFDVDIFKSMLTTGQDLIKVYSTKPGSVGTNGMVFEGIEVKEFPVRGQQDRLRVGQQLFCPFNNNFIQLDEQLVKLRTIYCQLGCKALEDHEKVDQNEMQNLSDQLNALNVDYSPNLLDLLNESIDSLSDQVNYILSVLTASKTEKFIDNLISLIPVDCVHPLVDLVAENNRRETKISIQNHHFTPKMLKKLIQSQFNAICKGCVFIDETARKPSADKSPNNKPKPGSEMMLTVYKHRSVDLFGGVTIEKDYNESTIISTMRGNFCLILVRETLSPLEEKLADYCRLPIDCDLSLTAQKLYQLIAQESNYIQVGSTFCQDIGLRCLLYRRKPEETTTVDSHRVIKITGSSECFWFDEVKRTLDNIDHIHRLWLVADESAQSGLLGLTNCLSLEPAFSNKIRCIFTPDQPFNQSIDLTKNLIDWDLLTNVYAGGVWGFYRVSEVSLDHQYTLSPYVCLATSPKSDGQVQWIQNEPVIRMIADDPSAVNDLVTISYSSLNFRDVLLAKGKMPPNAYPDKCFYRLGTEFSGYYKGQRVMGVSGGNSFSTHLSPDDPYLVTMKIPDHWTLAQAATVPVCYMTVVYGLLIRGNLQPGETVLIHSGSGGVGLAAIFICLSFGCKIFTTVSTMAKQQAVQRIFPQLTDESFANSRSASFEETILKCTNGRGVDIVLNSLIHDKFDASLRILAENGRFIDLSKVDIYEDKMIDRMDLKPNISIHAVCLATLLAARRTDEINKIVRIIEDGIVDGMIKSLPYMIYHHSQVSDAFADMSSAKHVGKLIVQINDPSTNMVISPSLSPSGVVSPLTDCLISCVKQTVFNPSKSYLIIGGLGGMGLELILWMVERGARKVIITSRSGIKTSYQRYAIRRIRSIGANKIEISRLDAAHGKSALRLIREASRLGPIGGIFNLAVVLKDGLFPNQTLDAFRAVCWPKIEATRNMDTLSRQHCPYIDYFVCFSSVSSQGNLGQSNYGYANSYMERICDTRRKDGLPGLAIQWGPVGDVGIAVRTMGEKQSVAGFEPQRIHSCLEVLDIFLQAPISIGFSAIPILDKNENDPQDALIRVSRILGVKDIRLINLKLRLRDFGMDSVQAIEVQEYLEQNFNFTLGAVSIYDITLENLVKIASIEVKSIEIESSGLDKIFRPLKTTGSRPVFFFPPAIFDFLGMLPLARGLDRQVYGIDFTDDNEIAKDWQTLTDYYCAKILDQWPSEPTYDFVSYSLGATFAFEVARKIQNLRGEKTVQRIVFIDSTPYGIHKALSWSAKISETIGNVSIDKEALLSFLKRMDRKQGNNSWRARTFKNTQQASNVDLTEDLMFTKYQYISEMKIEPKLKADALFFKCKHTVSSFEGSIAVSLDKSIDGHLETILVDSNHAEIITQCKDLLISECNKFLAV